jgi:hypothetical protein
MARLNPMPPPVQDPLIVSLVESAPAPRNATLLNVWLMQPVNVKLPAGILTTKGFERVATAPAEESALLIELAVTEPPKRVLQLAVVQFAQEADGMSPTTPAVVQSAARLGAMIPDQF